MAVADNLAGERGHLIKLVGETYRLLTLVVERHPRWIPKHLRTEFERAIKDVENSVEQTKEALRADQTSASDVEKLNRDLKQAGLTGVQLDLKTKLAEHSLADLEDATIRLGKKSIASKKYAKGALQGADVPLETLAKVIPVAGPLLEAKLGVEWALDNTGVLRALALAPFKAVKAFKRRVRGRSVA